MNGLARLAIICRSNTALEHDEHAIASLGPLTISLFASSSRSRQVIYRASWPVVRPHTLTVTVVGTHGHPRVDVDGFEVLR